MVFSKNYFRPHSIPNTQKKVFQTQEKITKKNICRRAVQERLNNYNVQYKNGIRHLYTCRYVDMFNRTFGYFSYVNNL